MPGRRNTAAVTTDLKLGLQLGYWTAQPRDAGSQERLRSPAKTLRARIALANGPRPPGWTFAALAEAVAGGSLELGTHEQPQARFQQRERFVQELYQSVTRRTLGHPMVHDRPHRAAHRRRHDLRFQSVGGAPNRSAKPA